MQIKEVEVFKFNNVKQAHFYDMVMKAIARINELRYFFYGGAIRGGKTFVCLFILIVLARLFPRSRWHIFRSDFPELEDTTIPSMEKLLGTEGKSFVWKRKSSNYHVLFENGSKIFFKSENLAKDNELNWMLGLETNGIFLEQMEGLSLKLFDRAIERVGSWYIPNMPPPIILGTFNPTDRWVKKKIYDPYRNGTLPDNYFFEEALPDDNPYVTADQWANWENLDPVSKAQLIKGIWRFLTDVKLFAYSFRNEKHVADMETPEGRALMTPNKRMPLKIIFDFNVDPITAIVCQNDQMKWGKVYAEYRLRNSDIFELTERIMTDWGDYYLVASGDASGRARSALTKGNRTYIHIIQKELKLTNRQLAFPTKNPSVANTRVLMNSIFHRHEAFWIASTCQFLVDDLETVKVNDEGDIDKGKDKLKTHLLDNLRYFMWNNFSRFIQL
jgi:hypothetical protein